MKKPHLLLMTSLLLTQPGVSQTSCPPAMKWQRLLGGTGDDEFSCIHQVRDGGFVLGGTSASGPGGMKTSANFGRNDFWVVRLDHKGRKLWDKSFGGRDNDSLSALRVTSDGGFILGGVSASKPGGNKTSPDFGGYDFWIVRLNKDGEKLWEKSFGGSDDDILHDLQQTRDGGFILGGGSASSPSGNKTSAKVGSYDFWVVRLDGDGNKLWDQSFGSSWSSLSSLEETADGGFILGSSGGPSLDYWLIRLDSSGLKLWDRYFGGSGFDYLTKVRQTKDGGLVLSGYSDSGADGNKTSPNVGGFGPWIVRLDATGNRIWDTAFGGDQSYNLATDVQETRDGGFMLAGFSGSWVGNGVFGNEDAWVAKLDFDGHLIWKADLGSTNNNQFIYSLEPTSDGGFMLCGASDAASGFQSPYPLPGTLDGWLVKLDSDDDCDQDGVPDSRDHCPDTPPGAAVDANGCSIAQLCPCEGPWKNHEEYVERVAHVAAHFRKHGLISEQDMQNIVQTAERSDCGNPRHRHPAAEE